MKVLSLMKLCPWEKLWDSKWKVKTFIPKMEERQKESYSVFY